MAEYRPRNGSPRSDYVDELTDELAQREGFREEPYQDQGGQWTIGYGRTWEPDYSARLGPGTERTTPQQEREWTRNHVQQHAINPVLGVTGGREYSPQTMKAVGSYVYNVGWDNAKKYNNGELVAALQSGNEGAVQQAVANGVATIGGQPSPALQQRRIEESGGYRPRQQGGRGPNYRPRGQQAASGEGRNTPNPEVLAQLRQQHAFAPVEEAAPDEPTAGDYGKVLMQGFAGTGEAILGLGEYVAETFGADSTQEFLAGLRETAADAKQYWFDSMTDAGKRDLQKKYASMGEDAAWKDLDSILFTIIGTAPSTVLTMGPAGWAARAAYGKAIASGATKAVATKAATKAAVVAGAATEGGIGAGGASAGIADSIANMKQEELEKLPEYQALKDKGFNDQEIRKGLIANARRWAAPTTGLITGAIGALAGPLEARLFTQGAGRVRQAGVGGAVETIQEAPQSATEQLIQNVATGRPAFEGVGEATLQGAVGGFGAGAGMGALTGARPAEAAPVPEQEAPPTETAETLRDQLEVVDRGTLETTEEIEAAANTIALASVEGRLEEVTDTIRNLERTVGSEEAQKQIAMQYKTVAEKIFEEAEAVQETEATAEGVAELATVEQQAEEAAAAAPSPLAPIQFNTREQWVEEAKAKIAEAEAENLDTDLTYFEQYEQENQQAQQDPQTPNVAGNTPAMLATVGTIEQILTEDAGIRSRAGKPKDVMARSMRADAILHTLASQLNTFYEQGYDIAPLRKALTKPVPPGVITRGPNKGQPRVRGGRARGISIPKLLQGEPFFERLNTRKGGMAEGAAGKGNITHEDISGFFTNITETLADMLTKGPNVEESAKRLRRIKSDKTVEQAAELGAGLTPTRSAQLKERAARKAEEKESKKQEPSFVTRKELESAVAKQQREKIEQKAAAGAAETEAQARGQGKRTAKVTVKKRKSPTEGFLKRAKSQVDKDAETPDTRPILTLKGKEVRKSAPRMSTRGAALLRKNAARILPSKYRKDILKTRTKLMDELVWQLKNNISTSSEGGKVLEMAPYLEMLSRKLHQADPYKALLQMVLDSNVPLTGKLGFFPENIIEQQLEDAAPDGLFVPETRHILINDKIVWNDAHRRDYLLFTLMHEVTHAATHEGLRIDNKFALKLDLLREYAKQYLQDSGEAEFLVKQEWYGLTDVDEFVSELFSNPDFQILMNDIPVPGAKPANVFTKFLQAVAELFGWTAANPESVLAHGIALAPKVFSDHTRVFKMKTADKPPMTVDKVRKYAEEYAAQEGIPASLAMQMAYEEGGVEGFELDDLMAGVMSTDVRYSPPRRPRTNFGMLNRASSAVSNALTPPDRTKVNKVIASTGTRLLGIMTFDTIETEYRDDFAGLGKGGSNPLVTYIRNRQRQQAESKKFERAADPLHTKWTRIEKKYSDRMEEFNQFIQDSTMLEVDPSVAWNHVNNMITRNSRRKKRHAEKAHQRLRQTYLQLPAPMQQLYKESRDFYKDTMKKMKAGVIKNILELHDLGGVPGLAQRIDSYSSRQLENMPPPMLRRTLPDGSVVYEEVTGWETMASTFAQLTKLTEANGPYFPLYRFGDFGLEFSKVTTKRGFATREAANDAAAEDRQDSAGSRTGNYRQLANGSWAYDHTEDGFLKYESESEAREDKAWLESEGFTVSEVSKQSEFTFGKNSAASNILAVAEKKLKGQNAEFARVALRDALITFLPATSMQKRMLKRKKVSGANLDNRRAFANYAKTAGHHLASLKFRKRVDDSFVEIMEASKLAARRGSMRGVEIGEVADEIKKRHLLQIEPGKWSQFAAKMGFINYLMSLSYSAVNATQPLLMSVPYLSGKYGRRKAMAAMAGAYRAIGRDIGKTVMASKGGISAFTEAGNTDLNDLTESIMGTLRQRGQAGAARMIKTLTDMGIIDATFSLEIAEGAKLNKDFKLAKWLNTVIEAGRFLPYTVEIMNRSTTAVAAYNLARDKGMSHEQATEIAREAVVKTQFDYTMLNRPRWFAVNDLARAATMFKIHPLGVYSYIIHNTRKALGHNATAEQKAEARRGLSTFLLMHGALAGGVGSLLAEPIKAAIGLVNYLFDGDDDDSWLDNPELAMRDAIYEFTGDKKVAEVLTYGLPRAAGVDLSSRVGLQSLMLMWQEGDNAWQTAWGTATKSLVGPIFGYSDSINKTVSALQAGAGMEKALEYMLPKGVRDSMRAIRYKSEGMTDFTGSVIIAPEEFTPWELAVRAFGFSTGREAEVYEKRQTVGKLIRKTELKRKELIASYHTADDKGAAWARIQEFNEGLPEDMWQEQKITQATLARSRAERRKKERETIGGVRLERGQRHMRERLESFGY
jgi:GH24 family phage-related lysozyme (muramidase)